MKRLLKGAALFTTCATILMLSIVASTPALGGDLISMDMRYEGTQTAGYPVHLTVNIYEDDQVNPGALVGTAEVDFDGASMSNLNCDAVVCITDVTVMDGRLVVNYTTNGWENDTFKNQTTFEVLVGDRSEFLYLHTSCSQTIYVERPYPGTPGGVFYVEGGEGDCFVGSGDCPLGNDLYWLVGQFRIPCTSPGTITFNLYRNEDDLKATATAYFNGGGLSDIQNSFWAEFENAYLDGDDIVVEFIAYGTKDGGDFESNSRFEMVTPCGAYYLDQHTSCSEEIYLNTPLPATPAGDVTYVGGCGGCIETGEPPVDCPYDDKLYWVAGEFRVACLGPADLTFQVFEGDHWTEPEGTATAFFNGTSLQNVSNGVVALIMNARQEGGIMVVEFEAFGWDDDKFKNSTSFELTVAGCGTFRLVEIHTSCSQPIPLGVPLPMETSGTLTLTNYCGCEDSVVPIESTTWGNLKSLYR
ncbi:MAG: hypothetical protein QNL91_05625 [Candidatus Krumholzibacteria bacterium]|nr:hypothetical protein [Candidatus Krumholzibacteria bacterium]